MPEKTKRSSEVVRERIPMPPGNDPKNPDARCSECGQKWRRHTYVRRDTVLCPDPLVAGDGSVFY